MNRREHNRKAWLKLPLVLLYCAWVSPAHARAIENSEITTNTLQIKSASAKKVVKGKSFFQGHFKFLAPKKAGLFNPITDTVGMPLRGTEEGLRGLQDPLKDLSAPIRGVETSISDLKPSIDGLNKPLTELTKPLSELQQPITQLRKPLNDLKAPLANLDKPLRDLAKPVGNLQAPLEAVTKSTGSLQKPLDRLASPLNQLHAPLQSIGKPLDNLQTGVNDLLPQVNKLGNSVDKLQDQVSTLAGELKLVRELALNISIYLSLSIVFAALVLASTATWLLRHSRFPKFPYREIESRSTLEASSKQ